MFHLLIKTKAKIEGFLREISLACSKCFSKFYGNFTVFFFNDEKRMNVYEKLQYFRAVNFLNVLLFPIKMSFAARCVDFIETTAKVFKKPFHKTFVCCRNVYAKIELPSSFGVNFNLSKHNTSFAVNNTCEISQFFPMIHGVYNV